MEFLVELLLEFLIQVFGEILLELGLRALAEPFRKTPSPRVAIFGYALLGFAFGGLSLWVFPHHVVAGETWKWVNVLVTPLAAGACMGLLGSWRVRRGQSVMRIDRFNYGYLFALCFAAVRFIWAA